MQGRAVRDRGAWGGMAPVLPLPLCSLSPWAQNTLSDPTRLSCRDPSDGFCPPSLHLLFC